jgi:ATP-dependent Lon protease
MAVELRQRVHDQLVKMAPGEFQTKRISFPGMVALDAPDLERRVRVEELDVQANLTDLVGRVSILRASEDGFGDVAFAECSILPGSGLHITGLRGRVLDQSLRAAYDAVIHGAAELGVRADRLRARQVAVHLVNISDLKDGPSAGLAFALAIISAATGRPVRRALAVTGEISMHGHVSEVGGIPAKLRAAAERGRKLTIVPAANAPDLEEVPGLLSSMEVVTVRTLVEAVGVALLGAE